MGMHRYIEFKCRCTKKGAQFRTVLYCAWCLLFGEGSTAPPFSDNAVKMLIKKGVFKNSFEYDAFVMEYHNDDDDDTKIGDRISKRTHDIFLTKKEWKMVEKPSSWSGPEYAASTIQRCPKCKTEIEVLDYYA